MPPDHDEPPINFPEIILLKLVFLESIKSNNYVGFILQLVVRSLPFAEINLGTLNGGFGDVGYQAVKELKAAIDERRWLNELMRETDRTFHAASRLCAAVQISRK